MSSDSTKTTWRSYSPQSHPQSTLNCSSTTKQLDTKSDKGRMSYSPTETNSLDTTKPSSRPTVSELKQRVKEVNQSRREMESLEKRLTSAIVSMEQRDVSPEPISASTSISARDASRVDMERWTARSLRECEEIGRRPRYLRYNVYRDDDMKSCSCSNWTEVARPFPSVPLAEYTNQLAISTIERHPDLFLVDTPIHISNFESLLTHHPNPPFVQSVVNGLRNGFWPWADTRVGEYPYTLDESLGDPMDQCEFDFIYEQRNKEISAGRFSESFGVDLLPGMYSMPIHAVPKPHSTYLRLVTNHSAGGFSLNSMIFGLFAVC
jgi:hypothetical protein